MPEKDTRLIFIEILEPYLSDESKSRVTSNMDIIEQRLAEEFYFGRFIKRLQDKLNEKQQEIKEQQDVIESLKNYNACVKEEYESLIESDKRRVDLEIECEKIPDICRQYWTAPNGYKDCHPSDKCLKICPNYGR
jgi:hypothetical protein